MSNNRINADCQFRYASLPAGYVECESIEILIRNSLIRAKSITP